MKNRFIAVLTGIFLALVLGVGGILLIIVGVRNARAVVKYESVTVDEGTVRYLASYYKMNYIVSLRRGGIDASDTEEFWQSVSPEGKTYSEHFEESFESYLASLVAGANIYLTNSKYTAEDKRIVAITAEEILRYHAGGSVDKFNEEAKKFGFDWGDFENAAALLYKASRAKEITYGAEGRNLVNFPDQCALYLGEYTHVSLLFIRTSEIMERDEEGSLVYNDDGSVKMRPLTTSEREERMQMIVELNAAIEAKNTGNNYQINEVMFENYLLKSDGDPTMYSTGYYFNKSAAATAEFASVFPEIVEKSYEMAIGDYEMVECSIGICFIYRYNVTMGAYSNEENPFFSDFYSDAADYLYNQVIEQYIPEVTFKDSYYDIDLTAIPKINEFYIRQFKQN